MDIWTLFSSLKFGIVRTGISVSSTSVWFHVKHLDPIPYVPEEFLPKIRSLEDFLRKASRSQNLISDSDLKELRERHILDSLAPLILADHLALQEGRTWVDIGSGAGLPVLPLSIALPHWKFIAIEPRPLRAQHIQSAIKELDLANLQVYCAKSESVATFPNLRGSVSIVSTRAVGKIPEDARRASPFLEQGGTFLTFKHEEIVAAIDGYHPLSYVRYRLPNIQEPRSLVMATLSTQAGT